MGWIRIHGGDVRCLGTVGTCTFGSNGWPVLTQSWACLLLAQIGDSARAQTVHGAYLTRPPAPAIQYQQQYLSSRINTFFRWQLNACMHCPAVKEKKVRHHLCSALLLLSLSLFPHISHISYYANNLDILLFLFVLALPLAANGVPFAGI